MSMTTCIPDLIRDGKIPAERADELQARYDVLLGRYEGSMSRAAAETRATNETLKLLKKDLLQKKRNKLLQSAAQNTWLDRMRIRAGENALDVRHAVDDFIHIDKKMDAMRGRFFASMDQFLARYRRNILGNVRNKAELDDIGRELFGEDTGNLSAREMANAMREVMELARTRFNQAGGDIGKLESFGLPQRHDSALVRAVDYSEWRNFGAIDRAKVIDSETGDFAVGLRREEILQTIHETIRTQGTGKASPGQMFAGAMANRRNAARYLHFDNSSDWMEYQQRFGGNNNIYDIFVQHVSSMAREVAIMEEMGPNPAATLRFQQDWVEKSVKRDGTQKQIDKVSGMRNKMSDYYAELTGANKIPDSRPMALGFSALRSQQVAAKLGGALISAVPDFATLLFNSNFNGLPVMRVVGRYLSNWSLSGAGRNQAVRAGLVTGDWLTLTSSSARYVGEELTGEVSRRLADGVIRGQGLARHTRNGQWAFGMEFIGMLTDSRALKFSELDDAVQSAFTRHNLSEADWDAYRQTKPIVDRGTEWIYPADVEGAAGDRILTMIHMETDFAVIMPDLRTRTQTNSLFRAGTFAGEAAKSTLLFKSFPMAVINLHGRRMMQQQGAFSKAKYGIALFSMMLAGGALAAQLKTMLQGKDPVPMDNRKFLGKAIVQSGGLGIFGDLMYNSQNSYGGGIGQTLLGPLLGQTVPNFSNATFGNAGRYLDGDEETKAEFGKDISMAIEKELPGRNLWYTRMAWERLITDNIRAWTDPDAEKAYDRIQKRAENEGTEFFWQPGAGSPDRLPDLNNAVGEATQ